MKNYRCIVCGYIHEGEQAPDICPVCGESVKMFEPYNTLQNGKISNEALKVVIIGAGIAGLSCAEEIRKNSNDADITLISADIALPYYRLSLTRYIAKEIGKGNLPIYPQSFYDNKNIKLICQKEVSQIIIDHKQVELSDETIIDYDKLVIASGADPFVPPIPGNDILNVVTVRNTEDADFILHKINNIESCICIGGGTLGLEVACAIAKSGVKVTLLEGSEWLMQRNLNRKAAEVLKKYLMSVGVEVKEQIKVQKIVGKSECEGVMLSTGEVLQTKLLIITTGVKPNTVLATKAGLEVNRGLVVNSHMQTSREDIFAAGDVTEYDGKLYGLWNIAKLQGIIAAQNVMGKDTEFAVAPIATVLKVLGLDMFCIGEINPKEGNFYQYEKELTDSYITFTLSEDKIIGSIVIGNKALSSKVKRAVEKGISFPHESFDNFDSIMQKLIQDTSL